MVNNKIPIMFRNTIPEIPSTTYGTFAIYKYPAKFIPQVIAYVLKQYAKPNMKIFDPFAGYGSVGVVSQIYNFDYELWDLNPMIDVIHTTATMKSLYINIWKLIKETMNSKKEFIPNWSNLTYWFPKQFISMLSKAWGFVHSLTDERKYIMLIPLINVTRYFSFADEKVHKLYKSKHSKEKIAKLLSKNWELYFYDMLEREMHKLLNKITEHNKFNLKKVQAKIKSGVDVLEERLTSDVNILITSPPYLQAQEYIRSTKLELFWLGYSEEFIRQLSKKEIPYRHVNPIKIYSEKYYHYRDKIQEKHLQSLYDRYFYAILSVFSNLGQNVTDYMCIFVGPAKIKNIPIEIDEIIIEHLKEFGWRHEVTFIDKIVSRVLFAFQQNSIKTEHLVILKRV